MSSPNADIVTVSDSLTRIVETREPNKIRTISETSTIGETLQAFKNGQELIPPVAPVIPEVPNLIGTRERRLRVPRRAPLAIVIDEISNVAIAPLKLLAFRYEVNKAISSVSVSVKINLVPHSPEMNAAKADLTITMMSQRSIARCAIKTQLQPSILRSKMALLSSPLCGLGLGRLKTRPETQSAQSLKAVNFEKMYKVMRIMKIAMMAESL
jgi:hypothetical protein